MPRIKWEYKITPLPEGSLTHQEKVLNVLGEEGWELMEIKYFADVMIGVNRYTYVDVAYLKREIQVKESDFKTC